MRAFFLVSLFLISIIAFVFFVRREPARKVALQNGTNTPSPVPVEEFKAPVKVSIDVLRKHPLFDKTKPLEQRVPSNLFDQLPHIVKNEEIQAAHSILFDKSENDTVRHEIIELLRRSNYRDLPNDLIALAMDKSEQSRFRAFVVQHISEIAVEGIAVNEMGDLMRTLKSILMNANNPIEPRREALWGLAKLKDVSAFRAAEESIRDVDGMSDISIHCLFELGRREMMPEIRKLSVCNREETQIAAIVVLGKWRDQESMELFQSAASSKSPRVSRAGIAALERLRNVK